MPVRPCSLAGRPGILCRCQISCRRTDSSLALLAAARPLPMGVSLQRSDTPIGGHVNKHACTCTECLEMGT